MVVGRSRQETLDPGFVLFGTRQQGTAALWRIRSRVTQLHISLTWIISSQLFSVLINTNTIPITISLVLIISSHHIDEVHQLKPINM
ncbi:unnamed protein product [Schistosoma margrebowiei]|uniref:Uncharacterized protein n=1 Tax=Schistosoma margrebowiei TaxID=48269 RepID=A0A183LC19_9TREM|nr:unnamed protein product [Schistosoma margrebowiei]